MLKFRIVESDKKNTQRNNSLHREVEETELNIFFLSTMKNHKFFNDDYGSILAAEGYLYYNCPLHLHKFILSLINQWDGKKRLETVFIDYLKADDTELTRKMTRNWFVNAVRNLLSPMSDWFPHMLVLVGEEWCGKTCVMQNLFRINEKYYTHFVNEKPARPNKFVPFWTSVWGLDFTHCLDEMMKDNDKWQTAIYGSLYLPVAYRRKFAREISYYAPHNCVYATSNDTGLLNCLADDGDSPLWVINCHGTEKEFQDNETLKTLRENVYQIWAEALYYYLQDPDADLEIC